ncbi:hypothetical protein QCA50_012357 [Cerrena zonata]|uniref:Uncharacterized protein n=1 Tax=Cerrena zonata TaxID=2478898 RepID=A0AAW0FZX0_9APHY
MDGAGCEVRGPEMFCVAFFLANCKGISDNKQIASYRIALKMCESKRNELESDIEILLFVYLILFGRLADILAFRMPTFTISVDLLAIAMHRPRVGEEDRSHRPQSEKRQTHQSNGYKLFLYFQYTEDRTLKKNNQSRITEMQGVRSKDSE